jgi:hypothetical protein
MQQGKTSRNICKTGGRRRWRQVAAVIMVLMLPGLLGAWRIVSGDTIDRRHVERIQDGKTTKNEILLIFGDPKEIDRTPEGVIYTYKSFKDAPAMLPYKPEERQINPQSDQLFVVDDEKKIKKAPLKTEGKILKSTLVIRFKPASDTVMSHEYKEF